MTTIFDVAKYIVSKADDITAIKLQKICYYSQAWSLVWNEKPIFDEPIEAWIHGPVVPALYELHRGIYKITPELLNDKGDVNNLSEEQKKTIDIVFDYYKKFTPQQLSDITHSESPWRDARRGLLANERGNVQINHASMAEYYSSLKDDQD